jgi:hypothetical protein
MACAMGLEFVHFGFTGTAVDNGSLEGRGHGEAGGEGLCFPCRISNSLTHRYAVPPYSLSRKRARAVLN